MDGGIETALPAAQQELAAEQRWTESFEAMLAAGTAAEARAIWGRMFWRKSGSMRRNAVMMSASVRMGVNKLPDPWTVRKAC